MEIEHSTTAGPTRLLWQHPWKFRESIIIILAIVLLGLVLSILTNGYRIQPVVSPYNYYLAVFYPVLLIVLHFTYRKTAFGCWLSGIPSAMSAITLFGVLILLMGIVHQENDTASKILKLTGISHIKSSFLFLPSQVFLLITLGSVTLRHSYPFTLKNIRFFIVHFGLLLTLLAATLGAGDVKKLTINLLEQGEESSIGISENGELVNLPFSAKLLDFDIEEFNPKMTLVNARSGIIKGGKHRVEKGSVSKIGNWEITVLEYFPLAIVKDGTIEKSDEKGSCPAAKINAKGNNDTLTGWITSGGFMQSSIFLALDSIDVLMLSSPESRKYSSKLVLKPDSSHADTVILEVNKPIDLHGWKLYQAGYDQSKGKWSSLSIIEAVKDPWLPVVYAGLFMLIAGVVLVCLKMEKFNKT